MKDRVWRWGPSVPSTLPTWFLGDMSETFSPMRTSLCSYARPFACGLAMKLHYMHSCVNLITTITTLDLHILLILKRYPFLTFWSCKTRMDVSPPPFTARKQQEIASYGQTALIPVLSFLPFPMDNFFGSAETAHPSPLLKKKPICSETDCWHVDIVTDPLNRHITKQ